MHNSLAHTVTHIQGRHRVSHWPRLPAHTVVWTLEQEHKVNLIMEHLCLLKAACTHPSPSPHFPEFQNKLQHLFLSRFTGAFVYDLPVISCVSSCVFVTKRVGGILLTRSRKGATNNVTLERKALECCHHTYWLPSACMLSEIPQRSGASIVWGSVKTQRWRGEKPQQQQKQTESDGGGRATRPTSRQFFRFASFLQRNPDFYTAFYCIISFFICACFLPSPTCSEPLRLLQRLPVFSGLSDWFQVSHNKLTLLENHQKVWVRVRQRWAGWIHLISQPQHLLLLITFNWILACSFPSHAAVLDSVRLLCVMDLPLMWRPGQEPFTMYIIWIFVSNPVEFSRARGAEQGWACVPWWPGVHGPWSLNSGFPGEQGAGRRRCVAALRD